MTSIEPRLPASWISDEKISFCTKCNSAFNMIKRKHHCRSCGNIFCGYCCYQFHSLPSYVPATHRRYCDGKKHRVCDLCISQIRSIKRNKNLIFTFSSLPLSILTLHVLREVCNKWKRAIDCILSVYKSIHHKVGYQEWSTIERRLVKLHWKEFTGHSRLMTQSIRAMHGILNIDYMVNYFMQSKQIFTCTHLFCHRTCSIHMNHFDIINILMCFPSKHIIKIPLVQKWIGRNIALISYKWLYILLPWLLQPFTPPSNALHQLILTYIIPLVQSTKELVYRFYFICNSLATNHSNFYQSLLRNLLQVTPYKKDLLKSHEFLLKIKYPNNITEYDFDGICLPYNPNIKIKDVQVINIKQLNTYTMPYIIPIDTYENGEVHILLKHDDLRKDLFVINIMHMMMELDKNIHFVPYHVLPVDSSFGIVEMLKDSTTLQDINKNSNLTNWIIHNNIHKTMLTIRSQFMISCASNCILTYILGVGDRNLGNISIKNEDVYFGCDKKRCKCKEFREK